MRGRYWQRPAGTCLSVEDADVFDFVEQRDPTEGEWQPLHRDGCTNLFHNDDPWERPCPSCGAGGELLAKVVQLVRAGCRCRDVTVLTYPDGRVQCWACGVEVAPEAAEVAA